MKIVTVKSSYSETPLAEVRTDGRIVEFIVDNTDGSLPEAVGKDFSKLKQYVDGSSHLSLEEPKKAAVGIFRYILDNGDVAEVSSDGKTVLLNGKLLDDNEKQALFSAIKRGEISVSRKADISQPIPIFATSQQSKQLPLPTGFNKTITDAIKEESMKRQRIRDMATKSFDGEIENMNLAGAEDPEWIKQFLYKMKYGE